MILIGWLLLGESSPFYNYLLWHPAPRNLWAKANLTAFFAGIVASGNVHQPSVLAYVLASFLQWSVLGYLISVAVIRQGGKQGA